MSKRKSGAPVGRRRFLKSATLAGAAAFAPPVEAVAQIQKPPPANGLSPRPMPPAETAIPPKLEVLTEGKSGSDFMVDCLKNLGFEFMAANPASSFRGLHESIVNYGGNRMPEFLTCTHEEISVAMAHGYYKVEGKPLCVMAHGVTGLMHATMALYNAWCDRVPVFMVVGNMLDAVERRPGVEWSHSVQDAAVVARDYLKWDDTPVSLQHFAESAVRAYKIAMTPPTLPVLLVADASLAENPIAAEARLTIPKLPEVAPPQGEPGAIAEAARLLVAAENPVVVADRLVRSPAGLAALVELAETLQCAVLDTGGRMNFPTRHKLNQSSRGRALITQADCVLGLEVTDFWGTLHSYRDQLQRSSKPLLKPGARTISLSANDLYIKANYQSFQRFADVDMAIAADGEATLPALVEAVKRLVNGEQKAAYDARGKKLAAVHDAAREQMLSEAAGGWDASPISTARLNAELWAQIRDEDYCLAAPTDSTSGWAQLLWQMDKPHHYLGGGIGTGIGYSAPASVGAALANRKHGRLTVALQNDGDLMMTLGVLWTAAHHNVPILSVMHNNRAYFQEYMHVERMAARHQRGIDRVAIGTTFHQPFVDYARVARGLGVHAEGPIADPAKLGPALRRAVEIVRRGEPALVDVVTQGR